MHWTCIRRACMPPTLGSSTGRTHGTAFGTHGTHGTYMAPLAHTAVHGTYMYAAWYAVTLTKIRRCCSTCEERKCHLQVQVCAARRKRRRTCCSWIVLQIASCSCSRILHFKSVGRAQRLLMKRRAHPTPPSTPSTPPRASHVPQGEGEGERRAMVRREVERERVERAGRKWNQGDGAK